MPQGSVIGPTLFLCYVNDIVNLATTHDVRAILYADGTVIYKASEDVHVLQQKLQDTTNDISTWCNNNRIKLNVSKTVLLLWYQADCQSKQIQCDTK